MFKRHIIALTTVSEKPKHGGLPLCGGLILPFLLLALLMPASAYASDDATLDARKKELATLKKRMRNIDDELGRDKALRSAESKKLRQTEQQIAAHASALRELQASIERQSNETRRLKKQQAAANNALARQRALLAGQLRASYQNGRQEKIKLLLNQGDPARIGRMLGYHEHLARNRSQGIEQVDEQARGLKQLEATLALRLEELRILQEVQQAQLSKLEIARGEREARLAELEAEIKASGKALEKMQAEQGALQRLIGAIRKQLSDIPAQFADARPLSQSEGRLPWPLSGQLLARYGQKKHGTSLQWDGIWIAAKAGTPVRAVAEGRVVYVGWLHRYGLLVITEHQDGYYSLYGHNQQARVEVGNKTKAGQIIAYAGDSGGHAKSGLYFELRKGKKTVNPLLWLARQ